MNQKSFKFDLDYFPLGTSNIFQNIKIEHRNKNKIANKNRCGIKRLSFRNQLNFEEITPIFCFEYSNIKKKGSKQAGKENIDSNRTHNSHLSPYSDIQWSEKKEMKRTPLSDITGKFILKEKNLDEKSQNNSILRKHLDFDFLKEAQNELSKYKLEKQKSIPNDKHQKKISDELERLDQCSSQFNSSQTQSLTIPEVKNKIIYNDRVNNHNPLKRSDTNQKMSRNYLKNRKTQKSKSPRYSNNPENQMNKYKTKKSQGSNESVPKQKNKQKLWNSLFNEQNNRKTQKKFISLNKKGYYVAPSKSKKNQNINKQKRIRNKSTKVERNIVLQNEDIEIKPRNSFAPLNECVGNSFSSTTSEKNNSKGENKKAKSQYVNINNIMTEYTVTEGDQKKNIQNPILLKRPEYGEIIRRTNEALNRYKGQCSLLRKQKQQYESKYKEAIKKLKRIKQQLEIQSLVMTLK